MKRSKAYRAAAEKVNVDQLYSPEEALALVASGASAKFDETVDVAIRLGVDPKKADQMVRGTVNLPHGTGKTARVLVDGDFDRDDVSTLSLGLSVVSLAELHDVDTMGTKSGTNGRGRGGLSRLQRDLDDGRYFLLSRHVGSFFRW